MELMGAIEALAALKRHCRVELSTDSVYVRDGITKWVHGWQRNGWKTAAKKPVANADLWQRLIAAPARHDTAGRWVKGPAGHGHQTVAETLASTADLGRARERDRPRSRQTGTPGSATRA